MIIVVKDLQSRHTLLSTFSVSFVNFRLSKVWSLYTMPNWNVPIQKISSYFYFFLLFFTNFLHVTKFCYFVDYQIKRNENSIETVSYSVCSFEDTMEINKCRNGNYNPSCLNENWLRSSGIHSLKATKVGMMMIRKGNNRNAIKAKCAQINGITATIMDILREKECPTTMWFVPGHFIVDFIWYTRYHYNVADFFLPHKLYEK